MLLNDEQNKKIQEHINKKVTLGITCSVCRKREWGQSTRVFELPEFQPRKVSFGGPRIPVVVLTCANCGNTLLFNAISIGIVQPIKKEV